MTFLHFNQNFTRVHIKQQLPFSTPEQQKITAQRFTNYVTHSQPPNCNLPFNLIIIVLFHMKAFSFSTSSAERVAGWVSGRERQ